MTRWFFRQALLVLGACALVQAQGQGATFKLLTGESVSGEPASFNPSGVVFKLPDGNYGPRIAFTNLTQEALKQIAAAAKPKDKALVEPFLEPDEEELAEKRKAEEIKINTSYTRLPRPDPKAGLGALTSSAVTLVGLVLLYLANLYAGYEVGVFRNYHPALTIAVAALVPVLGPVVFLCLPTRLVKSQDELAAEAMAAHLAAQAEAETTTTGPGPTPEEIAAQEAAAAAAAAAEAEAARNRIESFQRGQTIFNRRFFESRFAGFAKTPVGEAERDKVIVIQSARGEYWGPRLTRIDPAAIVLQVRKAGATADVEIPFSEINEIQIRPAHLAPA